MEGEGARASQTLEATTGGEHTRKMTFDLNSEIVESSPRVEHVLWRPKREDREQWVVIVPWMLLTATWRLAVSAPGSVMHP